MVIVNGCLLLVDYVRAYPLVPMYNNDQQCRSHTLYIPALSSVHCSLPWRISTCVHCPSPRMHLQQPLSPGGLWPCWEWTPATLSSTTSDCNNCSLASLRWHLSLFWRQSRSTTPTRGCGWGWLRPVSQHTVWWVHRPLIRVVNHRQCSQPWVLAFLVLPETLSSIFIVE